MATSKAKKTEQLSELQSKFENAKGVAFVQFDGLTVEEAQTMRRGLRADGMSYTVIKKTLIQLAAKNAKLADFAVDDLEGAVAVIVSDSDEIAPAAAIKKYRKEFKDAETSEPKLAFAGSVFEGRFLSVEETTQLANTPSREESLAKIIGFLNSGPQKLHGVFNSGFQSLYNVLQNADTFAAKS